MQMSTTTTQLISANDIQKIFDSGATIAASILQSLARSIWIADWKWIIGGIIMVLITIVIKILTGQIDRSLGQLISRVIFVIILIVAVALYGFKALVSSYFDFFYPASVLLMEVLMHKLRRRF